MCSFRLQSRALCMLYGFARKDGSETHTQMWPGQSTARYGLKKKKTVLTALLKQEEPLNFENVVRFGSFMFCR